MVEDAHRVIVDDGPHDVIRYDTPGVLTEIDRELIPSLATLPSTAVEVCRVAQSLLVSPDLAGGFGIPEERHAEKSIRGACEIIRTLMALDSTLLHEPRPLQHRVVGTCRHFAVLSVAFLRHRDIAARARCGFASYFVPGKFVDHWIVECWDAAGERWVRIDAEMLGFSIIDAPTDLSPGEFLTGGEAWVLCRDAGVDPSLFGVHGAPHAWGIGEIRGNAIRDLAALNKVEMLPWDEWGRMNASYNGETGSDFDQLVDAIAKVCASGDPSAIRALYATEELSVPPFMIV